MSTIQMYEDTILERVPKALERLRLARKAKVDAWIVRANTRRSKPCFSNLWMPPEETDDIKVLKAWARDENFWEFDYIENAFKDDENRLKLIMNALYDSNVQSVNLVTLSLEDAALINKWFYHTEGK